MHTIEPPSTISIAAPSRRNRTRWLAHVCFALLLASSCFMRAQPTTATDWKLTWSDEFNGPNGSPPDPSKWVVDTGSVGAGNGELETYTNRRENLRQQDGHLVITGRKEDFTGSDGVLRNYTSARINSSGLFTQAYGRFEARIQLPVGKGIWPAFWLLGDNYKEVHWPKSGEIDILETIGAPSTVYCTIHGPGYSGDKAIVAHADLPSGQALNTAFHVYAVEWSPNDIRFYVDDHLITHRTPADLPPGAPWAFDHPFYIIMNLAIGGLWPGNPDETTVFPAQMLVDYVRVYSRKPAVTTVKQGAR
jgi:beta-glucanase (GH16 family)